MSLMAVASQRETEVESGGLVKGLAIAVVTQNKDPDGLCRVKVRYPWHEKQTESYWARLSMSMAGDDRGFVWIPEIGDEVLVGFEREDLRFPHILGSLYNGKAKPFFANSDGKNDKRGLKSRKKHQLVFDDGSKGSVELRHEKGRRVLFDDSGILVEDENGNTFKIDSNSGGMTIEAKGTLNIKAASITIQATGSLNVTSNATLALRGSLVNIN